MVVKGESFGQVTHALSEYLRREDIATRSCLLMLAACLQGSKRTKQESSLTSLMKQQLHVFYSGLSVDAVLVLYASSAMDGYRHLWRPVLAKNRTRKTYGKLCLWRAIIIHRSPIRRLQSPFDHRKFAALRAFSLEVTQETVFLRYALIRSLFDGQPLDVALSTLEKLFDYDCV